MAHADFDIDFYDKNEFEDWKKDLLRHEVDKFCLFKKLKGGHKTTQGVWLNNELQFMVEYCYGNGFFGYEKAYILHLDGKKHYCILRICPKCGEPLLEEEHRAFCPDCNPPFDWANSCD